MDRHSDGYNWPHNWCTRCDCENSRTTDGKKDSELDKRESHYTRLANTVFIPLKNVNLVVKDINNHQDDLKLSYDISHLEYLPDYDYAKEHIHQDLHTNITPVELQKEVVQLNSDVDDYFDTKVPSIIVNSLQAGLDNVSVVDSEDSLPDNTISYNSLKPLLIRRWVNDVEFKVSCTSGHCRLNNTTDFANIPLQDEQNLISIINNLKNHFQVTMYVKQLRERKQRIVEDAKLLSDSINKEIIKIQHKKYNTKCSICSTYR